MYLDEMVFEAEEIEASTQQARSSSRKGNKLNRKMVDTSLAGTAGIDARKLSRGELLAALGETGINVEQKKKSDKRN